MTFACNTSRVAALLIHKIIIEVNLYQEMKQLGFVDVVSYNTILKASKQRRLVPVVTNIQP